MPTHFGGFAASRNLGIDLLQVLRGVRLKHALAIEHHHARSRDTHDDVSHRLVLLGEQLGGDDAGRVACPLDLDVRVLLVERFLVGLQLIGFEGGVDVEHGLLGVGGQRHGQGEANDGKALGKAFQRHARSPG